jgi:hypothetical protein
VEGASVGRLQSGSSSELESLVRVVRDDPEHDKGCFNDSPDPSEGILALRNDARAAAKRVVNFFVLKRQRDLGFVSR